MNGKVRGRRARRPCLAIFFACVAGPALAIDRITLEIGQTDLPGASASGTALVLDLRKDDVPTARAAVEKLELDGRLGTYTQVEAHCPHLKLSEPELACHGRLRALGGPLRKIAADLSAAWHTGGGRARFELAGLAAAGGTARLTGTSSGGEWVLAAQGDALDIRELREIAAPWVQLPADLTIDGRVGMALRAATGSGRLQVGGDARLESLSLANEAGTLAAENLGVSLTWQARSSGDGLEIEAQGSGTAGQALAGPVLLDFAANSMQVAAQARVQGAAAELSRLEIRHAGLLTASASGRVSFENEPRVDSARVEIAELLFPGAYTSYLQLALAGTDFGNLQTRGRTNAVIEVEDEQVVRIDARLDGVALEDARGKLGISDLSGEWHWASEGNASPPPSHLAWSRGSAYGLSGGAATLDFLTWGRSFELTRPARLPVFDGALVINTLALRRVGSADAELDFDGRIEPISMPLLSRAFGWPEMAGQLGGEIPGVTYRNRELTVEGDLVANVFDGTIVGRNIRLRNPLGRWPHFHADLTARRLDLELVTRTFPIGRITGRLDAEISGLELFDWSPIAFDARLYSTPGDRSRRVISQKAITSISDLGGGGGIAAAALSSGVLRFFDDFRYDRIGLSCRLRNGVCLMGGIEPLESGGYSIVRGRGIPRIDVIGNVGDVDWPDLVSRIVARMRATG